MEDNNAPIRNVESTLLSDSWGRLHRNEFDLLRSDGTWQRQVRETYDRGDGAAVLVYDDARNTVLLVRQFRFPVWRGGGQGPLIEVCAGLLDEDDPAACVRREAAEEMGVEISDPHCAFVTYSSPGSVVEKLHLFVARYTPEARTSAGGGEVAEGEDIEILELTFREAMAMVDDGRITDAKTILLLQYTALKGLLRT